MYVSSLIYVIFCFDVNVHREKTFIFGINKTMIVYEIKIMKNA